MLRRLMRHQWDAVLEAADEALQDLTDD
jgi:hypothetical protein